MKDVMFQCELLTKPKWNALFFQHSVPYIWIYSLILSGSHTVLLSYFIRAYIGAKRWNLSYPVFSLFNDCAGRRATWWPHLLQIHYSQEISRMFCNICEVPWESESRGPLLCYSPCDLPVTKSYWMYPKYLSSHSFSLRHLILTPESQKYPAN